jgi:hypothetical protein
MGIGPFYVGQVPADPQVIGVLDEDTGDPRDLSSYTTISAILVDPKGSVTSPFGAIDIYDPAQVGRVVLHWGTVSPFTYDGEYVLTLKFSGPGTVLDYSSPQEFDVNPMPGSPGTTIASTCWASVNDVQRTTGEQVDTGILLRAQFAIEAASNRTMAMSGGLLARDVMWLNKAVCWQAAWLVEQVDFTSRSAMSQLNQDGLQGSFSSKAAIYLAPLAIRCLKNVSWIRSHSITPRTPFLHGDSGINPPWMVDDEAGIYFPWEPISGGVIEG